MLCRPDLRTIRDVDASVENVLTGLHLRDATAMGWTLCIIGKTKHPMMQSGLMFFRTCLWRKQDQEVNDV
jgi:hypothetical protein